MIARQVVLRYGFEPLVGPDGVEVAAAVRLTVDADTEGWVADRFGEKHQP